MKNASVEIVCSIFPFTLEQFLKIEEVKLATMSGKQRKSLQAFPGQPNKLYIFINTKAFVRQSPRLSNHLFPWLSKDPIHESGGQR